MIKVRRSEERGHMQLGWLDTHHTFSFGEYYDEEHMGFRSLRVINDDRVAPGRGFGTHPHRDMEILTYVMEGALEHRDSMGNGAVIRPGEVQVMSAGTGITHSEFNPSPSEPVHLLQIWFLPERKGLAPRYDQKLFSREERQGTLRLVASRDEGEGSVLIQQDAALYATLLDSGQSVGHSLREGRHAWVHVARGAITLNGVALQAGDGAAVSEETRLELTGVEPAEVLLFDLG